MQLLKLPPALLLPLSADWVRSLPNISHLAVTDVSQATLSSITSLTRPALVVSTALASPNVSMVVWLHRSLSGGWLSHTRWAGFQKSLSMCPPTVSHTLAHHQTCEAWSQLSIFSPQLSVMPLDSCSQEWSRIRILLGKDQHICQSLEME